MTKEEALRKVDAIAKTLGAEYEEKFRKHCDGSRNLALTLRKERSKDEWKKFLDKKEEEKNQIKTIFLKDENGKVKEKDGKKLVDFSISYEDLINHPEFKEMEDEKRKKEILLYKAIGSYVNALVELDEVCEYIDMKLEKGIEISKEASNKVSYIRDKMSAKRSEMKAQLGKRIRGERTKKEDKELSDLF